MAFDGSLSRRSALLALAAPLLRAQQEPGAVFSAGVKVVNLFANVRNKQGEIVKDLAKDDFYLSEDGRQQAIKYFSQESNLPLTLGLLVDTSGSQRNLIDEERSASYKFFEEVLRPEKDVAFVIHFDFDTELLQDLTSSRKLLDKALDELGAPQQLQRRNQGGYGGGGGRSRFPGAQGPFPGSGGGRGRNGGTVLYDAVMLASDELMKKQTGRKALIILSDGVDTGSKVELSTAVEAAQRADTLVYSILFEDESAYGGGGFGGFGGRGGRGGGMGHVDGRRVLEQISRETGGRFFRVSKKEPLSKVYEEIDEDLRHQYSLGYTPDNLDDKNRLYRKIRLTTKQKGLIVQAREGYYPS